MSPNSEARVKRGRPPTSSLPIKILEGLYSDSNFKCSRCSRDFPRNKSLQAHLRTHTGEKPYVCDYPDCDAAFRQSGHLRSHIYRHTGEKPYACPIEACKERFIHSNRHCTKHKSLKLIRDSKELLRTDLENLTEREVQWFQTYKEKKFSSQSFLKENNSTRKRSFSSTYSDESSDHDTSSTMSSSPVDMNSDTSGYSPLSTQSSPDYCELVEEANNGMPSKQRNSDDVLLALERGAIAGLVYLMNNSASVKKEPKSENE